MDLSRFQDRSLVQRAAQVLRKLAPDEELRFMHVCGTHENTITRYGIRSMIPDSIRVIPGPGCPVCVTSTSEIDQAIEIASRGTTVYTYGDMFGVPGTRSSLKQARAQGARVRVVYSLSDAIKISRESEEPGVFFAIGFETTAPTTASAVLSGVPEGFSFLVAHRLIPPALTSLLDMGRIELDGLICPGHVSTIIGANAYRVFAEKYGIPVAISGFEPLDVILSLVDLVRQHKEGAPRVFNEYSRCVRPEGNRRALEMMSEVFEVRDAEWRGIGTLPMSGLGLRDGYADLDAARIYRVKTNSRQSMPPGCRCSEVLLGTCSPTECPLFGSACTPARPVGPCMVSGEGTCRIWFQYGGYQKW